jgi:hypothetical protein
MISQDRARRARRELVEVPQAVPPAWSTISADDLEEVRPVQQAKQGVLQVVVPAERPLVRPRVRWVVASDGQAEVAGERVDDLARRVVGVQQPAAAADAQVDRGVERFDLGVVAHPVDGLDGRRPPPRGRVLGLLQQPAGQARQGAAGEPGQGAALSGRGGLADAVGRARRASRGPALRRAAGRRDERQARASAHELRAAAAARAGRSGCGRHVGGTR